MAYIVARNAGFISEGKDGEAVEESTVSPTLCRRVGSFYDIHKAREKGARAATGAGHSRRHSLDRPAVVSRCRRHLVKLVDDGRAEREAGGVAGRYIQKAVGES
jgi:hypothetical protein